MMMLFILIEDFFNITGVIKKIKYEASYRVVIENNTQFSRTFKKIPI